jgi:hypothetical protein
MNSHPLVMEKSKMTLPIRGLSGHLGFQIMPKRYNTSSEPLVIFDFSITNGCEFIGLDRIVPLEVLSNFEF